MALKYEIGDRVRVYDIDQTTTAAIEDKGVIEEIDNNRLWVRMDFWGIPSKNAFWFHKKQCRRLVKKKKSTSKQSISPSTLWRNR